MSVETKCQMPIFGKIALNIGDFMHFEDFSNMTKHQIFKQLYKPNGA